MKARTHKNSTEILPRRGANHSEDPLTVINDDLSVFKHYPAFNIRCVYRIDPATAGKSVIDWELVFNIALMDLKEKISYKDPRFFAVFGPYCRVAYDTLFIHIEGVLRDAARVLMNAGIKPCYVQLELHATGKTGRISLTVRKIKHFGGM